MKPGEGEQVAVKIHRLAEAQAAVRVQPQRPVNSATASVHQISPGERECPRQDADHPRCKLKLGEEAQVAVKVRRAAAAAGELGNRLGAWSASAG